MSEAPDFRNQGALSRSYVPHSAKVPPERWSEAAFMLANGAQLGFVASALNISRTTLWRALKRAPAFRKRIAAEQQVRDHEAAAVLGSLRHDVARRLKALVEENNVRVLLALARELKIYSQPEWSMVSDDLDPAADGAFDMPLDIGEDAAELVRERGEADQAPFRARAARREEARREEARREEARHEAARRESQAQRAEAEANVAGAEGAAPGGAGKVVAIRPAEAAPAPPPAPPASAVPARAARVSPARARTAPAAAPADRPEGAAPAKTLAAEAGALTAWPPADRAGDVAPRVSWKLQDIAVLGRQVSADKRRLADRLMASVTLGPPPADVSGLIDPDMMRYHGW
ncbi:MAG TPA: hypothetical protein VEH84_02370 [Alphaproteobacteria bacterium]|nr:hypothetical protein [Alphaproteobacteria bacterium]